MKYSELLVPKEHRESSQRLNQHIWNNLMKINSAFPQEEIVIEHYLRDLGHNLYTIDMKFICTNEAAQTYLDEAYRRNMRLPRLIKPGRFRHHFVNVIMEVLRLSAHHEIYYYCRPLPINHAYQGGFNINFPSDLLSAAQDT